MSMPECRTVSAFAPTGLEKELCSGSPPVSLHDIHSIEAHRRYSSASPLLLSRRPSIPSMALAVSRSTKKPADNDVPDVPNMLTLSSNRKRLCPHHTTPLPD
ncbi:hypothetical protein Vi05172_g1012 [Venturia inaequalis]|nr:hypothetical protein Vi05172_g1012 [Venturia inaequalis]